MSRTVGKGNLKLWVVAGDASFAGPKPSPRPGESVGLFLRLLRERAGLTIDAAASQVRIRHTYLTAIEDDRFEILPGRAYAMGFVRAYAEFLGADVEASARAVVQDISRIPAPALKARRPEIERESRFAPLAAAGICIALAGYVYWYFEQTSARFEDAAATMARVEAPNFIENADATASTTTIASGPYRPFPDAVPPTTRTAAPQQAAVANTAAQNGAPLPPSRVDPSRRRVASPTTVATTTAPLPPRDALAANLPAPRVATPATSEPRWSIPAPGPAMAAPYGGRFPPGYAVAATAPAGRVVHAQGHVVLHALADTWLQIKSEKTGKILFSRVLREGEDLPAPDRLGLRMTVGNAGGLEIRIDGQLAPSLGGHGQIIRDVSLDAPALRTGR
ncbi:MAG: RodZ domain-containing protein [Alphaproteobacteria bacterium]